MEILCNICNINIDQDSIDIHIKDVMHENNKKNIMKEYMLNIEKTSKLDLENSVIGKWAKDL